MKPLPIVQYWHSKTVPAEVVELTTTFREHNPEFRHRLFCETEAEKFIASHFSDREVSAFRSCAVPAMQGDYFRYCAILALGGVYSDVGFRCLRPLRDLLGTTDDGLVIRKSRGQIINGFFLFKEPGHPLLRLALDVATGQIESRTSENVWAVTGPWIFTILDAFNRLESADAVRRAIAERGIATSPEPILRIVEDHALVVAAFDGVRVLSCEKAGHWIGGPKAPLAYKHRETHWVGWDKRETIFRA